MDQILLQRLNDALLETDDPKEFVRLLMDYYSRINDFSSTPTGIMFLHMGMLCGVTVRLLRETEIEREM